MDLIKKEKVKKGSDPFNYSLLPLTKEQNSKIKDANWAEKKKVFKGSNWKITQKAASISKWDQNLIKRRCKQFADWAIQEWPEIGQI